MLVKSSTTAARRHLLAGALFLLVPLVAARVVSVLYSYAATDVLYMTTALPTALFWIKRILSVIAFGGGIALTVSAAFRFGGKCGAAAFGIHASLLFLDFMTAFLIDVLSGAVSSAGVLLAFLVGFADCIWCVLFSLIAWRAACRLLKKNGTSARAAFIGAVFYMAGRLLLKLLYQLDFLIDVEFLPYPEEIAAIVGDLLAIVAFDGGVLWLAALGILFLLRRIDCKNEKFTNNL